MAALSTIQDDFSSGSLNGTRWPSPYAAAGGSVSVVSGALVINHNYDGTVPGWPPPDTGVWGQTGQIANSSVYCRYKPLLTDDNGAGNAHKAWDGFAVMNQANLEGFGFYHAPADGTNGSMTCKVFNNIDDEWWVDVGTISSYDPNGAHAWLRLRHSGTTFFWDTAPDNGSGAPGTWTNRFSYSQSGAGISFDNMSGFLGATGACIHFRAYHWEDTFSEAIVTQNLTIDGVNTSLVANVTHAATGAIVGGGATISGTAARNSNHDASGAVVGGGAVVSGAAFNGVIVSHDATGEIHGGGAVVTGTAARSENTTKTFAIKDAFDQASLDTATWSAFVIGGATAPSAITVSGGLLRLDLRTGTVGHQLLLESDFEKDFQGSQVYTRMRNPLVTANNTAGGEAVFGVHGDANDSGYTWNSQSDGTLTAQWRAAGASDGVDVAYTPSTHAWLRIKEEGGTVYWQHAPSSATDPPRENEWITDHTRTRAADGSFAISAVRIRFMVNIWTGNPGAPTGPVTFDSVNMRTTAIVNHDASGAIAGGGAVVAGSAAKRVTHDATGAIAGPGAVIEAAAMRRFEHTASGAIVGGGAIISAQSSTSDVTRKIWLDVQDTAGAWSDEPQSADPWTDVPPSDGTWGST